MTRLEQIEEARRRVKIVRSLPNAPKLIPQRAHPCLHLGEPTGDTKTCKSCTGTVSLKVFSCKVHKECTVSKPQEGLACCSTCKDYAQNPPPVPFGFPVAPKEPINNYNYPSIGKRHLLFHLLPVSGNGVWQKAITTLRSRWHLFTGNKFISIAQGNGVHERIDGSERVPPGSRLLQLDTVDSVRKLLPPDAQIIRVVNDPNTWEGASWLPLWDSLYKFSSPQDIVLYAHAKGVTRKLTSPCHPWTDLLYTLNLDHIDAIERILQTKPICGSLPKWGPFFGGILTNSRWHYSGNFWWGRCGEVLKRIKEVPLPINQWASEAWIGAAFHHLDTGVLFESRSITHLYHPHELERVIGDYAKWSLTHPLSTHLNLNLQRELEGL